MIKTPLSTMIGGAGIWTPKATTIGAFGTKETLNQLIKSLFANNEQGFAYDPNDLTTLYQDAAGTIPVTAAGQPVGLMLDKSKGLVLGNETITNGDFLNGKTGWTDNVGVSTVSNGVLTLTNPVAPPTGYVYQSINTVVGKYYKASVEVTFGAIAALSSGGTILSSASSTTGTSSVIFKAVGTTSMIRLYGMSNAVSTFKSVSVKELAGNHAYQSVSASRPILQRNATTGAYYLAFDGVDDFLQTATIDFTATDKVSLFTGVTKLADNGQVIAELSPSTLANVGSFYLAAGTDGGGNGYTSAARGSIGVSVGQSARNFTYLAPDFAVLSIKHDISGDLSSMRRNGVIGINGLSDKGTGNFGNYPLFIGRRGGTTLPFNGHLYSLIGIGRLTTDSETIALEKAIAKNTGVMLNV